MSSTRPLGRSALQVPRLGVGAMTWGDPAGLSRRRAPVRPGGRAAGADFGGSGASDDDIPF